MADARGDRRLRVGALGRYRYVRLRWRVLFAAIDFVGGLLWRVFRAARPLSLRERVAAQPPGEGGDPGAKPPHPRPLSRERERGEVRRILLVQLDHLGDAVISRVMLPLLRRHYPGASIEVLAGAWNREFFETMPEVDRVYVSRTNRFSREGRFGWMLSTLWWGWRLRRERFDLGIDVRGEFPHAVLLWLAGVRRRVGWRCGGGGFLLTDSPEYVPDRPEVESRLALLAELGIVPDAPAEAVCPKYEPPDEARRRVGARLSWGRSATCQKDAPWGRFSTCRVGRASWPVPVGPGGPSYGDQRHGGLAVLHVGAGAPAKQWPAEHWRSLAQQLLKRGMEVVLVGGPGERIIARCIAGPDPPPDLTDWTGQLTVAELAALLERARVAVGCDSGPAHLAAAVGTPVVVLFSGTNLAGQWRPRGPSVRVLRRRVACSPCHRRACPLPGHPCMARLLPEEATEAVVHGSALEVERSPSR